MRRMLYCICFLNINNIFCCHTKYMHMHMYMYVNYAYTHTHTYMDKTAATATALRFSHCFFPRRRRPFRAPETCLYNFLYAWHKSQQQKHNLPVLFSPYTSTYISIKIPLACPFFCHVFLLIIIMHFIVVAAWLCCSCHCL